MKPFVTMFYKNNWFDCKTRNVQPNENHLYFETMPNCMYTQFSIYSRPLTAYVEENRLRGRLWLTTYPKWAIHHSRIANVVVLRKCNDKCARISCVVGRVHVYNLIVSHHFAHFLRRFQNNISIRNECLLFEHYHQQ